VTESARFPRFARFAWGVVALNIAVILWGAFVRASGSGAGCGRHWPLCNGEVVPHAPRIATLIELAHRASSGVALVAVFALALAAWRAFPAGHRVRRAAVASAVLISFEALIGAGLVLFELVAHDASMKRALSISLHLTNTLLLLAALALTAWWASGGAPLRSRRADAVSILVTVTALLMIVVGMSGAIAALGDTLFPSASLAEGVARDFSAGAHLFVRLRVLHPFFAVAGAVLLFVTAAALRMLRPARSVRVLSHVVTALVAAQVAAGIANVVLLAPTWMQMLHLLLADSVWIAFVVLGAAALADAPSPESVCAPREEIPRDVALR
jgi:heme A synthase